MQHRSQGAEEGEHHHEHLAQLVRGRLDGGRGCRLRARRLRRRHLLDERPPLRSSGGCQPFWRKAAFEPRVYKREKLNYCLNKGDEIGLFEMGSTVIMLLSNRLDFTLKKHGKAFYGQSIS